MKTLLAQSVKINGSTITGPLATGVNWSLGEVINRILLVIIPLAGVILFLVLVWGGYDFLLSGGNPEKIKRGKARITTAFIGFLILILAFLIAKIVSQVFGLGQEIFQ